MVILLSIYMNLKQYSKALVKEILQKLTNSAPSG